MSMLVHYDPFRTVRTLQNEINRLFDRDLDESSGMMTQWPLRVDIREEPEQIVLQADIPGMEQKDIKIHVENNQLTIAGERTFGDEKRRDTYHRIERAYGFFSRTFQLGARQTRKRFKPPTKTGYWKSSCPSGKSPNPDPSRYRWRDRTSAPPPTPPEGLALWTHTGDRWSPDPCSNGIPYPRDKRLSKGSGSLHHFFSGQEGDLCGRNGRFLCHPTRLEDPP